MAILPNSIQYDLLESVYNVYWYSQFILCCAVQCTVCTEYIYSYIYHSIYCVMWRKIQKIRLHHMKECEEGTENWSLSGKIEKTSFFSKLIFLNFNTNFFILAKGQKAQLNIQEPKTVCICNRSLMEQYDKLEFF